MEIIRVITSLCVILSLISLSHSAAQEIHRKKASHDDQGTDNKQQIEFPVNPRKLKLINDVATVKNYGHNAHPTPVNKQEVASGDHHHGGGNLGRHARKGTRQEWMEGTNIDSEFYTMDYHWVRRRRPIHNKSVPFRHP